MKKNGFTVIEFIAVVALVVFIITLILLQRSNTNSQLVQAVQVEKDGSDDRFMKVTQFDGHKWVKYMGFHEVSIVHHPDCDCFKKVK
jgi:hypothetical protein